MVEADPVTLPAAAMVPFPRFTLYNSPYPAHDAGCAVDLYPGTDVAPSPVAGEVLEVRPARAPPKPYADGREHLLLVDTGAHVARILHVDPTVEPGDAIDLGDPLGRLVRSGYFAPWVANHVHLGFRNHDQHHHRATGSLPLRVDVPVTPRRWDGTGTVVETGETYLVLDAPGVTGDGERTATGGPDATGADATGPDATGADATGPYVGLASDDGRVLDGGLVHYRGGGALTDPDGSETRLAGDPRPVTLLGRRIGVARGRTVDWADVAVLVDGTRATGLSLFCARDAFGVKVVAPGHGFAVGDDVRVEIEPTADPTILTSR